MNTNKLSIIIPTCNRDRYLDANLQHLFSLQKKYSFDVIICNNSSTDNTAAVINKWKNLLTDVQVVTHTVNVGFDANVISGYKICKTDYCWLIGNSYFFEELGLREVLKCIELKNPDAIIIKTRNECPSFDIIYNNAEDVLNDLGWTISNLSSTIIRRTFIKEEVLNHFKVQDYDGFIHFGVLFENLSMIETPHIEYLSNVKIENFQISGGKSKNVRYWRTIPFEVFGHKWFLTVMSLPLSYSYDTKLKCIKDSDKHVKIFDPWNLFKSKLNGNVTFEDYHKYKQLLPFITSHHPFIYSIISRIPKMPKSIVRILERMH